MAYDKDCWTYWCDKCGCQMVVDYEACDNGMLVLRCDSLETDCDSTRKFFAEEEWDCSE